MKRRDKILNLFEFLMDLMDEPQEEKREVITETPVTKSDWDSDTISRIKKIMDHTDKVDEESAKELGVKRVVNMTLKPILEQLKNNETNNLKDKLKDRVGVTFDEKTGKLVEVDVPELVSEPITKEVTMEEALTYAGVPQDIPAPKAPKNYQPHGAIINVEGEFEEPYGNNNTE